MCKIIRYGVWRLNGLDQRTEDPLYFPLMKKEGIQVLFHETDTRGKKIEKSSKVEFENICTFDELLKCDIIDIAGEDAPRIIGMLPKHTKVVSRVLAHDTLENYDENIRNRVDVFMLNWKMPIPKDFPKEKCHYIAGPIETDLFKPSPEFKRTPRPKDSFFILYAGQTLFLTKGFGDLVNSVLSAYNKNNKIRLVLLGEDPSEASRYYENVTNGIIRYGGFLPQRELMINAYLESDAFCQPIMIGQGSTAMLEALSCGLPLLARDCGEYGYEKELIENNMNGYLCKDCYELSDKFVYLSNNIPTARRMGRYSRLKALREFNQETSTKKMVELIKWLGFEI